MLRERVGGLRVLDFDGQTRVERAVLIDPIERIPARVALDARAVHVVVEAEMGMTMDPEPHAPGADRDASRRLY